METLAKRQHIVLAPTEHFDRYIDLVLEHLDQLIAQKDLVDINATVFILARAKFRKELTAKYGAERADEIIREIMSDMSRTFNLNL